jgi:hypothetical protein
MKAINSAIFAGLLMGVGCVSVSVSEPSLCDSQPVSFPEPADLSAVCSNSTVLTATGTSAHTLPPQSATTTFDFSSDLSKIDNVVNDLTLQVNQLVLDNTGNNFGFVKFVEVDIQGADQAKFPDIVLATYTAPTAGVGSELNFVVNSDTNRILTYLEGGQVLLTITLTSDALTLSQACGYFSAGDLSSNVHLCVDVGGKFSKKL